MPEHFADRLIAACSTKGAPVCVGLDPVYGKLPQAVACEDPAAAIEAFSLKVIEAVADYVPAVKPQMACYERYGAAGYAVFERVVAHAKEAGLIVVTDGKRGDIGTSSDHYAAGLLSGHAAGDSLTVNGYLGTDGIQPFIDTATARGAGLFVLVRTSNPGGDAIQSCKLEDGRSVAQMVADHVNQAGKSHVGKSGYSLLGAVVGATKPEDAADLRERMPEQVFLVPGFGAQGGTADDVKACFKPDGTGALITSSRGVIYAGSGSDQPWTQAVANAAQQLRDDVASILA